MNVEYVVENIYFCHHPSWFGPYLALLQYLPTVLLFGAMYWSLNSRDIFFLNLSVTINISWLVVLLFQYAVYSSAIGRKEPGPSTDDDVDPKCRNFFPGILAKAWFIYEDDPISSSSVYRSWEPFPNSDIFLSGIYFGYVATYHLAWKVLPEFYFAVGLFLIPLVPWAFVSAKSASLPVSLCSFMAGNFVGAASLCASFVARKRCYYNLLCCCIFGRRSAKERASDIYRRVENTLSDAYFEQKTSQ